MGTGTKGETYLVFDEGGEGEVVEEVGEVSPYVRVAVLAQTFIVETVHLRDLSRFVVASQDGHSVAVAELECDKQRDGLYGVVASVDVVTYRTA